MPLDPHSYLVSQGWSGKGTGLRQGAITKPVTVTQKKTLSGVGKDRDEAFPFWDHLFSAAAKSIQIKISNDNEKSAECRPILERTTTGILSNRRPADGTPATSSGTGTPDIYEAPRYSLLVTAKREAAKRGLYAKFFRGPVLDLDADLVTSEAAIDQQNERCRAESADDGRELKKRRELEKTERKAARAARKVEKERKVRKLEKAERKAARAAKKAEKERKARKLEADKKRHKSKDRSSDKKRKRKDH